MSLRPKLALSLGMVLHELATNAGKYGALSEPQGRISIGWDKVRGDAGDQLEIRWAEAGGPEIAEPEKRGFGLTLIERETTYNLRGRSDVEFTPSGLEVKLAFPLDEPR